MSSYTVGCSSSSVQQRVSLVVVTEKVEQLPVLVTPRMNSTSRYW